MLICSLLWESVVLTRPEKIELLCDKFISYRTNPVDFAVDVIGIPREYIWPKLKEVIEAPVNHNKVAIKAGHSVSKTFGEGRIIVPWFKTCFQPSTVITTAPSDLQVREQLWREVHAGYAGAKARGIKLGGNMLTLKWDLKPKRKILEMLDQFERVKWEKNFAIGFSTSPDTAAEHATKMQGWHNEWVMIILDEACGLLHQITRTVMESLITDENCRVIASGNPTDPESDFARWCHSSDNSKNEGKESYISDEGWYVIRIDSQDNPNYIQNRRVIPGLAGRDYVDGIIKKYGQDGNVTRYRIKGLFPTFKEGTYYGEQLAEARRQDRIGDYPHDPRYPVYTFSDFGDHWTASIFVQFIQGMIRIIGEYWDYEGKGAPLWSNVLDSKKYTYMDHIAGPDLDPQTGSNRRPFATGKLLVDTLAELGKKVRACEKHDFISGIEITREIWSLLQINKPLCTTFIEAAAGYGKVKNLRLSTEDHIVYHNQEAQTWHRHLMDALRHMSVSYRIHQYTGDTIEGLYDYRPKNKSSDKGVEDLLEL